MVKKKTILAAATAAAVLGAGAAIAAEECDCNYRDTEAEALLKKMSDFMGGLKSFSADVFVADEKIMGDGFKLSVLQSGSLKVKRPNKMYIARKGMLRDQEAFFDGERLMVIYGNNLNVAMEVPVKGDIDAAMDAATENFGTELPARDLVSTDAYTPLMEPVQESSYLGTVDIGGMTCRQLAFRTDEVDWQLWVQEGDQPLPCRYTITSKWTYGAPNYTITFANWQVNPDLPDRDFTFTAPDGTKSVTVEEFQKMLESMEEK